ncbi:MAG: glutamate mutase L [Caldilineaceae bacterium]
MDLAASVAGGIMSERTLAAGVEPSAILALGMDVQQVSALLLEPVDGAHRVVGRHALPIRVSDGETFPPLERLAQVCRQLGRRLGRPLWLPSGEGPAMSDADPALGLALAHVVAVADPLPPLRVLVAGLSTGESLAAAQEALASAPCDVVALCRPGAYDDVAGLRDDIANAAPDAIVVCGGYDVPGGAARGPALALSELVAQAVRLLRVERPPLMVFAGNRWAAADVLGDVAGDPRCRGSCCAQCAAGAGHGAYVLVGGDSVAALLVVVSGAAGDAAGGALGDAAGGA